MRLSPIISILAIVILAGVYGAGTALPIERTTVIGTDISAPREIIWTAVANVEATAIWDKDIATVSSLPDPTTENGALWHFEYDNGQYAIQRIENINTQYVQYREIVEASALPLGSWKISISESTHGSFVKINTVQRTQNPWLRFMRYYFFQPDAEAREFLEMLASHYDNKPKIQELVV